MDLMNIIASIPHIGPAIPYIAAFILFDVFVLAPNAPPPKAQGAYAIFYTVVNAIAANWRYAKNAAKPPIPSPADAVAVPSTEAKG